MWMFEKRLFRRICGPERDEVTLDWRKLHNEELNDLLTQYCSGDQIEKKEMGVARNTYGREERCIQSCGGEPEGKRPVGRPRRSREVNINLLAPEFGI